MRREIWAARQIVENRGMMRDKSKHIQLRYLKVREYQEDGTIRLVQVPTKWQLADLFTKRLAPKTHKHLRAIVLGGAQFDHSLYDAALANAAYRSQTTRTERSIRRASTATFR